MRILSLNFREAIFGQQSGEVPIFLLTITHPDLAIPILLSTDPTVELGGDPPYRGTISRGQEFIYAAADVTLPSEQDRSPPTSKLILSNIHRDMIALAGSIVSPASVKIECVLASAPDLVEMSWPAFDMVNLVCTAPSLTFDLTIDALVTEPYPAHTFTPAHFPGLFP